MRNIMEAVDEMFEVLPEDYPNWQDTVIFFAEKDTCIDVYVHDHKRNCMFKLTTWHRPEYLYGTMSFAVINDKLYIVGGYVFGGEPVKKFSIFDLSRGARGTWSDHPKSEEWPLIDPVVFTHEGDIFVLSGKKFSKIPAGDLDAACQMDDVGFPLNHTVTCKLPVIMHHGRKLLFLKFVRWNLDASSATPRGSLFGYDFPSSVWHRYPPARDMESLMGNLLKASWSSGCAIAENHLFGFRVLTYPDGLHAVLVIRDLEHNVLVDNDTVDPDYIDIVHNPKDPCKGGTQHLDISPHLPTSVYNNMFNESCLVYLGQKDAGPGFSLIIKYKCEGKCGSEATHVHASTFVLQKIDGTKKRKASSGSSSTQLPSEFEVVRYNCRDEIHINVGSCGLVCKKYGDVDDGNDEENKEKARRVLPLIDTRKYD